MNKTFMQEAINLAREGMQNKGGPFGVVIVKDGKIVGRGNNQVTKNLDPSAHAEVMAIRDACHNLNTFSLAGCEAYSSCEPCPMCLCAFYWARVDKIYVGANRQDAKVAGFDDELFYDEIAKSPDKRKVPMQTLLHDEANAVFQEWIVKPDKIPY